MLGLDVFKLVFRSEFRDELFLKKFVELENELEQ